MNAEMIDLYRGIQDRRGEWKQDDQVYHITRERFGRVTAICRNGIIEVYYPPTDSRTSFVEFAASADPNLLWLPPPTPRHEDDTDGRNMWAWVNWDKYDLYVGTGGMVSVLPRGRQNVPFGVHTLSEALLRAVVGKE